MGILNVTPDSFSDGGCFFDHDAAIERARQMTAEGADIIDIGGESTRPGFKPVPAEQEMERVIPVIEQLSRHTNVPISVDTYKAKTAEAAIRAGAHMLNDIWGLKADPEMGSVAARYGVPICIMHNKAKAEYDNIIEDMMREISESIEIALKAGVKDENIIIDPGIGFGKTWEHNLQVMRHLEQFKRLGYPILLGASRKSFIGKVLDLPVEERLEGTIAATVVGIMKGVDIVRIHDVYQNKRAAVMTDEMGR
jgi:dihydropteroate synthase